MSRTASESGENNGINVSKVSRSILREINGNVSLTAVFYLFKHPLDCESHLNIIEILDTGRVEL